MYKVIFLCPDTNFVFDGRTPDSTGLGGGKTAFVRLARALADLGHDVTVYANCTPGVYDGVEYRHFDAIVAGACDVLVVMSTYAPDLSALDLGRLNARLRIVWVQGRTPINGLDRVPYDWLYAVSDYIKGVAVSEWGADAHRVFVTHNAYDERNLARGARRAPSAIRSPSSSPAIPARGSTALPRSCRCCACTTSAIISTCTAAMPCGRQEPLKVARRLCPACAIAA